MYLFHIITVCLITNGILAKPTSNTFNEAIREAAEDVRDVIKAKAAAVEYTGQRIGSAALTVGQSAASSLSEAGSVAASTLNEAGTAAAASLSKAGSEAVASLNKAGNAAAASINEASSAAADYVSRIDPIEATDRLEEEVISRKVASIRTAFDLKRDIIRALQEAKGRHQAQIEALINASIDGLNSAVSQTAEGLAVSKTVVADFAQNVTLDNTVEAVAHAFNTSNAFIQDTLNTMLLSLVQAKESLHDKSENFDSKDLLKATANNLAEVLNVTSENAAVAGEQVGFFAAVNAFVRGLAQLPLKINRVVPDVRNIVKVEGEISARTGEENVEESSDEIEDVNDPKGKSSEEFVEEENGDGVEDVEEFEDAEDVSLAKSEKGQDKRMEGEDREERVGEEDVDQPSVIPLNLVNMEPLGKSAEEVSEYDEEVEVVEDEDTIYDVPMASSNSDVDMKDDFMGKSAEIDEEVVENEAELDVDGDEEVFEENALAENTA